MRSKDYFIKKGYQTQNKPEYFHDDNDSIVWQKGIYDFAHFVGKRFNLEFIIDVGAGNGFKLKQFEPEFKVVAIDYGSNVNLLKTNIPNQKVIEFDLEKGLPKINKEVLAKAVVVCADVIEHLNTPHKLFTDLSKISKICPIMIISTPDRIRCQSRKHNGPPPNPAHVREWSATEIGKLMRDYKFNSFLIGHANEVNYQNKKNTLVVISGKLLTNPVKEVFYALFLSEIEVFKNNVFINLIRVAKLISKKFDNIF
ncbi:MAG: methyltransferase domain-containing protein [Candidatus Daviesbacteria bacterium]